MNASFVLDALDLSVSGRIDKLTFRIYPGWTGIIGRSGAGKSTLARVLAGYIKCDGGHFRYLGLPASGRARPIQLVPQDPKASFDPFRSLRFSLRLGPVLSDADAERLGQLGLSVSSLDKKPDALSGGQLQRLALFRALSVQPGVVILDEPTSALDGDSANQLLSMVDRWISEKPGRAAILVSHDLFLIRRCVEALVVLDQGQVVETGSIESVQHPVSRALLKAAQMIEDRLGQRNQSESPIDRS